MRARSLRGGGEGVSDSLPLRAPQTGPDGLLVWGIPIKYFVLVLLVVQNAAAVIMMRYVRSIPGETEFVTQTAVIMQEALKGLACMLILLGTEGTLQSTWAVPIEALKTSVPALVYLVQNNLQFVAVGYLDAATYTVTYQTKIVWSGLLTVVLLRRKLSPNKWVGLMLLTAGVAAVQVSGMTSDKAAAEVSEGEGADSEELSVEESGMSESETAASLRIFGLVMILAAAACSSLAGVYFEKILKDVKVSIWTRNLQLAGYSVLAGLLTLLVGSDGSAVSRDGFFHGYTSMTWACICMNAFGGLLVGNVIKYADAIMKDIALGASIVVSAIASVHLFGFMVTPLFCVGTGIVIYSALLYGGRATCCGVLPPPSISAGPAVEPVAAAPTSGAASPTSKTGIAASDKPTEDD